LEAVEARNERQKRVLFDKVVQHFGADLSGRRFGLWGLAFKPNTDDMREAPSRVLIDALLAAGAQVQAFDPVAMDEAARLYGETPGLVLCGDAYAAAEGADALVLVTEWRQFRSPDFGKLKTLLKQPVIFDGRNQYEPAQLAALGFTVHGIGRASAP
ncbi:MAG TPA: UDP binding domain-containing protein, partial [Gammaproteobacteria bacterium]